MDRFVLQPDVSRVPEVTQQVKDVFVVNLARAAGLSARWNLVEIQFIIISIKLVYFLLALFYSGILELSNMYRSQAFSLFTDTYV